MELMAALKKARLKLIEKDLHMKRLEECRGGGAKTGLDAGYWSAAMH